MSCADILAPSTRFTPVGRAHLCGSMAGGHDEVDRVIEILVDQIVRAMKLLQVPTLAALTPAHLTQLQRKDRSQQAGP